MPSYSASHPDPAAVLELVDSGRSEGHHRLSSSRTRLIRLLATLSLPLVAILTCLPALGSWCALTPDGVNYLSIARTLRETHHFPAEAMKCPPGFPVLLAPLMILGDTPFLAIRLLFVLCLAITSLITYRLYFRDMGTTAAWIAGVLVATSSVLFMQATVVLSEMAFLPLSLGVLLFVMRWDRERILGPAHLGWIEICAGGLLSGVTVLVRSMGITLVPVAMIVLLSDRRRLRRHRWTRVGLYLLSAIAPLVAWEIRQSAWPPRYSNMNVWTTAREVEHTDATGPALQLQRLARWGPQRLDDLKAAIVPNRLGWRLFQAPLDRASTWLIGGFFVALSLFRVVRDRSAIDTYCLLTLVMLAFWPWNEGVRLLIPLLPILIGNVLWLADRLWRLSGVRAWQRCGIVCFVGLMILGYAGERIAAGNSLVIHHEKAERRIAAMHALADGLLAEASNPVRRLGITPDGHNDKLLLAGAGYLARRPIHDYIDVHSTLPDVPEIDGLCDVFVHRSLMDRVTARWGWRPVKTCGAFELCRPAANAR
ncbi:MAG: ArnT family glycosyltransferase [Phycisphaerae bacterium]